MEYPFKFDELLLTESFLSLFGCKLYSGCGDYCETQLRYGNVFIKLYFLDEKDDEFILIYAYARLSFICWF